MACGFGVYVKCKGGGSGRALRTRLVRFCKRPLPRVQGKTLRISPHCRPPCSHVVPRFVTLFLAAKCVQALTSWLRAHGVVHMVLKSNMHQAQYADQVGLRAIFMSSLCD